MSIVHYASAMTIEDPILDHYNKKGVFVSRDAMFVLLGAARRDVHELETRGGEANMKAAAEIRALCDKIGDILVGR